MNLKRNYRPILLIANSSWYLLHYRKLLINKLKSKGYNIVSISPLDKSTWKLSKLALHIPWRITRSNNKNPLRLIFSLIRLIFIVRTLKPTLVHSHTLKTNFLTAITSFILGIPCVLSFAGLGQITSSKGIRRFINIMILKFIGFLSFRELGEKLLIRYKKRTSFIFQNKRDMDLVESILYNLPETNKFLIPGSGVPEIYSSSQQKHFWGKSFEQINDNDSNNLKFNLLYVGRLLKTKGILTFIELSKIYAKHNLSVYGGIDPSSKDSITKKELDKFKKEIVNINFHGVKDQPLLNQTYSFPILVVPSVYGEGLPRGIMEALILKIPVITSQEATCKLFDESLVYIAKSNDLESYVECIDKIIFDYKHNLLGDKLNKGQVFVKENLLENSIVDQTINVYEKIENEFLESENDSSIDNWLTL